MTYRPWIYRAVMLQLTHILNWIAAASDRAADACFWEARDPGIE
jgi:hypothetical protein